MFPYIFYVPNWSFGKAYVLASLGLSRNIKFRRIRDLVSSLQRQVHGSLAVNNGSSLLHSCSLLFFSPSLFFSQAGLIRKHQQKIFLGYIRMCPGWWQVGCNGCGAKAPPLAARPVGNGLGQSFRSYVINWMRTMYLVQWLSWIFATPKKQILLVLRTTGTVMISPYQFNKDNSIALVCALYFSGGLLHKQPIGSLGLEMPTDDLRCVSLCNFNHVMFSLQTRHLRC